MIFSAFTSLGAGVATQTEKAQWSKCRKQEPETEKSSFNDVLVLQKGHGRGPMG